MGVSDHLPTTSSTTSSVGAHLARGITHEDNRGSGRGTAPDHSQLSGSGEVSGIVEASGSRWLFSKAPVVLQLGPRMVVDKGFWDTRYSVFVTPDQDVRVVFR
jgi:hypothetical protein